jgi:tripartite-type tricarboxylate transporter receptor subunit TctC
MRILLVALLLAAANANAQFPSRPIRVLVPFDAVHVGFVPKAA